MGYTEVAAHAAETRSRLTYLRELAREGDGLTLKCYCCHNQSIYKKFLL